MTHYRLEYIETRRLGANGVEIIPVEEFPAPVKLDYVSDDYNEADRMRCELCSKMNFGYVKIVEEEC